MQLEKQDRNQETANNWNKRDRERCNRWKIDGELSDKKNVGQSIKNMLFIINKSTF